MISHFTRGKVYYARIRLPKDIAELLKEPTDQKLSLKTSNKNDAKMRIGEMLKDLDLRIQREKARQNSVAVLEQSNLRIVKGENFFEVQKLDGSIISRQNKHEGLVGPLVNEWFRKYWRSHFSAVETASVDDREFVERIGLHVLRLSIVDFYEQHSLMLPNRSLFIVKCIHEINKSFKYDANKIKKEVLFPEESERYSFARLDHSLSDDDLFSQTTLEKAMDDYFSLKRGEITEKTAALFRIRFQYFISFMGSDTLLRNVKSTDVVKFRDGLKDFPRKLPHDVRSKKDFKAAIAWKNGNQNSQLLQPTAINNYLNACRAILTPSCDRLGLKNPFTGIAKVKVTGNEDRSRSSFTDDDIALIFGVEFCKPSRNYKPTPSDFWCMIGSLLHGTRLNEWAQAKRDQFRIQDDIFVFEIRGWLKNTPSFRTIPIHPLMLKIGFRNFVENTQTERIFPELTSTDGRNYSVSLSRRLNSLIDRAGVIEKKKVVHSFRHTWKTRARLAHDNGASIDEEYRNAITGHADTRISAKYGDIPLSRLFHEIQKIDFPTLDIKHLKRVWEHIQQSQDQSISTTHSSRRKLKKVS